MLLEISLVLPTHTKDEVGGVYCLVATTALDMSGHVLAPIVMAVAQNFLATSFVGVPQRTLLDWKCFELFWIAVVPVACPFVSPEVLLTLEPACALCAVLLVIRTWFRLLPALQLVTGTGVASSLTFPGTLAGLPSSLTFPGTLAGLPASIDIVSAVDHVNWTRQLVRRSGLLV